MQIDPITEHPKSIRERRAEYMTRNAEREDNDEAEFEPEERSNEIRNIDLNA